MKSLSIVALLPILALAASRTAEGQVFPAPGAARNACACPSE
jgi:hypothetical protein